MVAPLLALILVSAPQSGLQSKVVRSGTGEGAKAGDVVTVLYKGTLKGGEVFDENLKRAPLAFRVGAGRVIKGWDEGLKGAKTGSKLRLTIPPTMAYGSTVRGSIPANSTLTFDIEVLRIDRENQKPKVTIVELKKGTGKVAGASSTAKVGYKGMFLNGVVFDESGSSSFDVKLGSGGVIRGFEDGIIGMRVGGKRKVTIPFNLAYGENGRPPQIPAMATLVFELTLVDVN